MYEQVERPKENKIKAVANSVAQKKSDGKQGVNFMDNRQHKVMSLAPNTSSPIQRVPQKVQIAWGVTHAIKKENESLFGDGDFDESEMSREIELTQEQVLTIENQDILISRRGPNQEIPGRRDSDRASIPDREWFRILNLGEQDISGNDFYLRAGTFIPMHEDQETPEQKKARNLVKQINEITISEEIFQKAHSSPALMDMHNRYFALVQEYHNTFILIETDPDTAVEELTRILSQVQVLREVYEIKGGSGVDPEARSQTSNIAFGSYNIWHTITGKNLTGRFVSASGSDIQKSDLTLNSQQNEEIHFMQPVPKKSIVGTNRTGAQHQRTVNIPITRDAAGQDAERKFALFLLSNIDTLEEEIGKNISPSTNLGPEEGLERSDKIYNQYYGEINIYTEMRPCESCENIIVRLSRSFPNVKVNVVYGVNY
ncbi:MAG: deaminase domain-containing protein [Colwellia sp.]